MIKLAKHLANPVNRVKDSIMAMAAARGTAVSAIKDSVTTAFIHTNLTLGREWIPLTFFVICSVDRVLPQTLALTIRGRMQVEEEDLSGGEALGDQEVVGDRSVGDLLEEVNQLQFCVYLGYRFTGCMQSICYRWIWRSPASTSAT